MQPHRLLRRLPLLSVCHRSAAAPSRRCKMPLSQLAGDAQMAVGRPFSPAQGRCFSAKAPKDTTHDADGLVLAMRKAIQLEDARVALQNYDWLKQRNALHRMSMKDVGSFILLLASSSRKPSSKITETLKSLFLDTVNVHGESKLKFSELVFRCLLEVFNRSRDYQTFDTVFEALRKSGQVISRDTLNLAMGSYAKRRDLDRVLGIFNELERLAMISQHEESEAPDHAPNTQTYLHLINGYVSVGKLDEAQKVLDGMWDASVSVKPSLAIFNAMIRAYALKGDFDQAMLVFEDMQTNGFQPNQFTYNNLINAYAKAGMESDALRTLQAMIEDFQSSPYRFYVAPNVVTLNILVNMYALAGKPKEAEQIIASMSGQIEGAKETIKADEFTLSALMNAYRRAGDMKGCEEVLGRFREDGITPNVIAYNVLIDGYADKGDFDSVRRVFGLMLEAGLKPNRLEILESQKTEV
ncbi:hypothetical protein HDU67_001348 [Dinochytrium kinnereticum]|nr:hypothetical protein HDU67_001348 [Dinochytrium kinnereticum]